jgi:hypothetical protein
MKTKKPIAGHSHMGNGKTYYFLKESDILQAKNMSYLYNLEGKVVEAFSDNAKTYFLLTQDIDENKQSFDKIFDVLTNNCKNKMKAVSEIQKILQQERIWRKRAELELKEIKNKKKNA